MLLSSNQGLCRQFPPFLESEGHYFALHIGFMVETKEGQGLLLSMTSFSVLGTNL